MDLEDLFALDEYLQLYNSAFAANLQASDLIGDDPILKRLKRKLGRKVDPNEPAAALLRDKARFLERLSEHTARRFESLIKTINATLPQPTARPPAAPTFEDGAVPPI